MQAETLEPSAEGEFDALAGTVAERHAEHYLLKIERKPTTLPNGEPLLKPLVPESWEPVDFMDKVDTAEFVILHFPGVDDY